MKWEYLNNSFSKEYLQLNLETHGKEGWECYQVDNCHMDVRAYFKRPLTEPVVESETIDGILRQQEIDRVMSVVRAKLGSQIYDLHEVADDLIKRLNIPLPVEDKEPDPYKVKPIDMAIWRVTQMVKHRIRTAQKPHQSPDDVNYTAVADGLIRRLNTPLPDLPDSWKEPAPLPMGVVTVVGNLEDAKQPHEFPRCPHEVGDNRALVDRAMQAYEGRCNTALYAMLDVLYNVKR